MKKILISIMTIAMVSALIGGGIYAAFSDTEGGSGNTFTTGTLALDVDGSPTWSGGMTMGPMVPGEAATVTSLSLANTGNITGDLYMRISSISDSGGELTEPEEVAEGGTPLDNISTQITVSCEIDTTAIAGVDGASLSTVAASGWVKIVTDFAGGSSVTFDMGGEIPLGVTNQYQGDVSSFTLELKLVQAGQPA